MSEILLVNVTDRVATIIPNRPEARNALSAAPIDALWVAVLGAASNAEVDVLERGRHQSPEGGDR